MICGTNWPLQGTYNKCPECQEDTYRVEDEPIDERWATDRRIKAMAERHAEQLAIQNSQHAHDLFEEYYLRRELRQFHEGIDEWLDTILSSPIGETVR